MLDQTVPFSPISRSRPSLFLKAVNKALYTVDIIADQKLLSEVQEYVWSDIRSSLSRQLKTVDPQKVEMRLHSVNAPEVRKLTIIYPVLDVQDKSNQWPDGGTRNIVTLGSLLYARNLCQSVRLS